MHNLIKLHFLSSFDNANLDVVLAILIFTLIVFLAKSIKVKSLFIVLGVIYTLRLVFIKNGFLLLSDIMGGLVMLGLILGVINNQKEINAFFTRMVSGSSKVKLKLFNALNNANDGFKKEEEIIFHALTKLKQQKEGALVVLEKFDNALDLCSNGVNLNADLSSELLHSIFQKTGPIHDGAVLISKGKVIQAGLILPLSSSKDFSEYGTRHRAAAGLSELCDARIYVLSEETGTISILEKGKIISKN